jgi:hypothetical protein
VIANEQYFHPVRNAPAIIMRCLTCRNYAASVKENRMLNDKEDCIETIIKTLERTSAWRKTLMARWPDDARNGRAVRALDNLSRETAKLTDQQWSELQPHYGGTSEAWRNGLNQAARQVGFHHHCGDLAILVKVLLENLASSSRVAA